MIFNVRQLSDVTPIDQHVDLNYLLKPDDDIVKIDDCYVKGVVKKQDNAVIFDINISTNLQLTCAQTFKTIPYDLDFDAQIVFSDNIEIYDYVLEDPIDLRPYLLAYIITEKPQVVYDVSVSE